MGWKVRIVAVLLAALPALVPATPTAATSEGHGYLALGDSVAFGTGMNKCNPPTLNGCIGYPEDLAQLLNIEDVNASCPGEASGGFISLTGTDNVCRPYRAAFPLHVQYSTPQLDFAVSYLRSNPRTRLVTLNIGANDLFVLVGRTCAGSTDPNCVTNGFKVLLQTLAANLTTIYSAIRATGYSGLLIALQYYVTNYADPIGVALIGGINQIVASVTASFGGFAADGFTAFQGPSAASGGDAIKAGLVIPGDIHPTVAGQALLAQTVFNTILSTCPAASAQGCLNRHR